MTSVRIRRATKPFGDRARSSHVLLDDREVATLKWDGTFLSMWRKDDWLRLERAQ
jgi:hypothetical protein